MKNEKGKIDYKWEVSRVSQQKIIIKILFRVKMTHFLKTAIFV